MVDMDKLHQFVGQMLSDLGGAASVGLVRIGPAHTLSPQVILRRANQRC